MPADALKIRRRQERLRRRFRPPFIKLLFVGESPPASGRLFYQGDSGLYRAMRDAFKLVDSKVTDENFLHVFQARGCYLIDLCGDPVDKLPPMLRVKICQANESKLARSIAKFQPSAIATVVRSIEQNVQRALSQANWHGRTLNLPYPGRWSHLRDLFVSTLIREISNSLP